MIITSVVRPFLIVRVYHDGTSVVIQRIIASVSFLFFIIVLEISLGDQ